MRTVNHTVSTSRFLLATIAVSAVLLFSNGKTVQAQTPSVATAPGANSGLFSVRVSGQGPSIVFIPGLSSSGDVWDGTVDHLKSQFQCHILTLAGFAGQPAWPDVDKGKFLISVEDQLAVYIAQQKLQRPIIVGHSLGGTMALQFAERYPELSGRLVIVDSLPFLAGVFFQAPSAATAEPIALNMKRGIEAETKAQYLDFVKSGKSTRSMVTSDADFATVTKWGLSTDQNSMAEAMYELLSTDIRPDLGKVQAKCLIFATWSAYPGTTSKDIEELYEAQYQGLKSKKIVMADKERHFIMLDNPTWFYAQLDKFLAAS